ncbi:MAG: histone deacetylase [Anaerolineales bacterium]|nr:histone deacetylase [Anaerolineales bacterium]
MKIFYVDGPAVPLPEGHHFPMPKYALLVQAVAQAGLGPQAELCLAEPASDEQLMLVHQPDYVRRVSQGLLTEKEMRRIGFPWSPEMVERSRRSVGATIAACRAALADGMAANLGGGTHHAYPDHGEGYCVFNDVAVAARLMQLEGRVQRVVILDCDVHQGNGTAAIFASDPSVFTFSVHGAKNFPFHKEKGSLDIALPDGSGDEAFLDAVSWGTAQALQAADADLAFYIAGADPYSGDRLGRMAVTKEGLEQRDCLVLGQCLSAGLPVVIVMGGGYSKNVQDIVDIHLRTIRIAVEFY